MYKKFKLTRENFTLALGDSWIGRRLEITVADLYIDRPI
jgi:hypothetical protein